jgi:hypothetical protein
MAVVCGRLRCCFRDIEDRLDRELSREIMNAARQASAEAAATGEGDESEYCGRSDASWSYARHGLLSPSTSLCHGCLPLLRVNVPY